MNFCRLPPDSDCAVASGPPALTPKRAMMSLAWARNCGAYVLEDDYDSDFFYDRAPLLALKSLDHHDQVVYLALSPRPLARACALATWCCRTVCARQQ